jgi:hypothetical protein
MRIGTIFNHTSTPVVPPAWLVDSPNREIAGKGTF